MGKFRIGCWDKAGEAIVKYFGSDIPLDKAFDRYLSLVSGYITIDVIFIQSIFVELGMSDNESMEQFVNRKYGNGACNLLKSML